MVFKKTVLGGGRRISVQSQKEQASASDLFSFHTNTGKSDQLLPLITPGKSVERESFDSTDICLINSIIFQSPLNSCSKEY